MNDLEKIDSFLKKIKDIQEKYHSLKIKFIYVIAPNKTSIYKNFLPAWIKFHSSTMTDLIVEKAQQERINLFNLFSILNSFKKNDIHLYYRYDSHWNNLGASIGFEYTIDCLNILYNLDIKKPKYNITNEFAKLTDVPDGFDLLKLLRFNANFKDNNYYINLNQNSKIMQCNINKENGTISQCNLTDNNITSHPRQPKYFYNKNAANNLRVLLVGDSFFVNNILLYRTTFSNVWLLHVLEFDGMKLENFININKPDIIIYQVVERHFPNEVKF